jgi:predicted esterase
VREHRLLVSRHARFFTLGDVETATDVWIVVHGYAQLASEFIAGFDGLEGEGRCIVAPEALNRFYREETGGSHATAPVGATWMTREDRVAEITDHVAYLDAVVQRVGGEGRRLTALGFSQGVATVTRWIALGTTVVDRVICWAGNIPEDVDLAAPDRRFSRGGVDLVVGSRDRFATWANLDEQRRRLASAGVEHRLHTFEGGHRLDRDTLRMLASR